MREYKERQEDVACIYEKLQPWMSDDSPGKKAVPQKT